jgi:hypothetical protein
MQSSQTPNQRNDKDLADNCSLCQRHAATPQLLLLLWMMTKTQKRDSYRNYFFNCNVTTGDGIFSGSNTTKPQQVHAPQ